VSFSLDDVSKFLRNPQNVLKLNKYAGHYITALIKIVNTKHMAGDVIICMHLIKNNMYCIFPVVSKVRNYGHDGSGLHCGIMENSIYCKQVIDTNNIFNYSNFIEKEDAKIYKILSNHFKRTCKEKISVGLNYLRFISRRN
jgi:hypothetical protein